MRAIVLALALSLSSAQLAAQYVPTYPGGSQLPATCAIGSRYYLTAESATYDCTAVDTWNRSSVVMNPIPMSSVEIPAGLIMFVISGRCPVGFTEVSALDGRMVLGTVAANGNVGGTGGNDNITPTVNSLTAAAQTFTGTPFSSVINHTHTVSVTDPGHSHLTQRYPTATGGSSGFTIDTSMSGTLADNTLPVKAATTGITAATANPAGGVASITPAGTNSTSVVTGTLNQFDNRSAFVLLIGCRKS